MSLPTTYSTDRSRRVILSQEIFDAACVPSNAGCIRLSGELLLKATCPFQPHYYHAASITFIGGGSTVTLPLDNFARAEYPIIDDMLEISPMRETASRLIIQYDLKIIFE